MLIVLPPSETKAVGGTHPPLNLQGLSFPQLNPVRESLISQLTALDVQSAMAALKLGPKLRAEAEANQQLRSAPTTPALLRYTGVLFDALDAPTLPPTAWRRLAIGSALFGLLMADDLIPRYRLSGTTKLGGRTMKSQWGAAISTALAEHEELILDLRSGTYQQLGPAPGAVTVRVETRDGKVVSHWNKHYKGELARVLAQTDHPLNTIEDIAEASGMDTRITSPTTLTLVVQR